MDNEFNIYTKPEPYSPIKQDNSATVPRKIAGQEIYANLCMIELLMYGLILIPFLTMALGRFSLMVAGVICLVVSFFVALQLKKVIVLKKSYEEKYGFEKKIIRWF